jgi:hypothetical protein
MMAIGQGSPSWAEPFQLETGMLSQAVFPGRDDGDRNDNNHASGGRFGSTT